MSPAVLGPEGLASVPGRMRVPEAMVIQPSAPAAPRLDPDGDEIAELTSAARRKHVECGCAVHRARCSIASQIAIILPGMTTQIGVRPQLPFLLEYVTIDLPGRCTIPPFGLDEDVRGMVDVRGILVGTQYITQSFDPLPARLVSLEHPFKPYVRAVIQISQDFSAQITNRDRDRSIEARLCGHGQVLSYDESEELRGLRWYRREAP